MRNNFVYEGYLGRGDPIEDAVGQAFAQGLVSLDKFGYQMTWNPLTANAQSQQATVTIDPGIGFVLQQITLVCYTTLGTAPVESPDLLLSIEEQSGATFYTNVAMDVNLWTGQYRNNGSDAGQLTMARYIRGNNTITGKLTNNTGMAFRVQMALLGYRVQFQSVPAVLVDLGAF